MPWYKSERSVSLCGQHTTYEGEQSLRQGVCDRDLQNCTLRKRHDIIGFVQARRPASDDLGVYRNAIQRVPDLVTGAPRYLLNGCCGVSF